MPPESTTEMGVAEKVGRGTLAVLALSGQPLFVLAAGLLEEDDGVVDDVDELLFPEQPTSANSAQTSDNASITRANFLVFMGCPFVRICRCTSA